MIKCPKCGKQHNESLPIGNGGMQKYCATCRTKTLADNNELYAMERVIALEKGRIVPKTAAERLTKPRAISLGWSEVDWASNDAEARQRVGRKSEAEELKEEIEEIKERERKLRQSMQRDSGNQRKFTANAVKTYGRKCVYCGHMHFVSGAHVVGDAIGRKLGWDDLQKPENSLALCLNCHKAFDDFSLNLSLVEGKLFWIYKGLDSEYKKRSNTEFNPPTRIRDGLIHNLTRREEAKHDR